MELGFRQAGVWRWSRPEPYPNSLELAAVYGVLQSSAHLGSFASGISFARKAAMYLRRRPQLAPAATTALLRLLRAIRRLVRVVKSPSD